MFPINNLGEYIECLNCKKIYDIEVLNKAKKYEEMQVALHQINKTLLEGISINELIYILKEKYNFDENQLNELLIKLTNNRFSTCPNCQLKFHESLKYCPECGTLLQ